jgi:3-oxoacyl-[acyl-carrier-protein] synthase-3
MFFSFDNINIKEISCAVPSNKIGREYFKKKYGSKIEEKIFLNTRITKRHFSDNKQSILKLAINLIKRSSLDKRINLRNIDAIVFISQTSENIAPGSSHQIHKEFKIKKDCLCVDLNYGCSAYPLGLLFASNLLQNKSVNNVLLIVGDTISKYLNLNDRSTASLFGDAASVSLIEKKKGFNSFCWTGSDGAGYDHLTIKSKNQSKNFLTMNGMEVFSFTLREVPSMIRKLLNKSKIDVKKIESLVLHQANFSMNNMIAENTNFEPKKNLHSITKFGNTSGASIPLTICENLNKVHSHKNYTLMVGFGIGLSWASFLTKLNKTKILPIYFI